MSTDPPNQYDVHDINKDGKLDVSDLNKLRTLCTRPGCATR